MNLILSTLASMATLTDDVTINPTADGMPGGDAMQKLVNWPRSFTGHEMT